MNAHPILKPLALSHVCYHFIGPNKLQGQARVREKRGYKVTGKVDGEPATILEAIDAVSSL